MKTIIAARLLARGAARSPLPVPVELLHATDNFDRHLKKHRERDVGRDDPAQQQQQLLALGWQMKLWFVFRAVSCSPRAHQPLWGLLHSPLKGGGMLTPRLALCWGLLRRCPFPLQAASKVWDRFALLF